MQTENPNNKPERNNSPEARILDPKRMTVTRDAFEHLRVEIEGEEPYEDAKVSRAFPISHRDRFIAFRDKDHKEIGILAELKCLESHSRRVVEEELDLVYFTPVIQRITAVDGKHGATTWKVVTDRGETTIFIKDRGDVRRLPGRRILFNDVHGAKYDLPDYTTLDDKSRTLLENEI